MTVRQTGPGAVTVSGYGITEDHTGVNRIFADGRMAPTASACSRVVS